MAKLPLREYCDLRYLPGKGLICLNGGSKIAVGTRALLERDRNNMSTFSMELDPATVELINNSRLPSHRVYRSPLPWPRSSPLSGSREPPIVVFFRHNFETLEFLHNKTRSRPLPLDRVFTCGYALFLRG
jgi:hypothetical protein